MYGLKDFAMHRFDKLFVLVEFDFSSEQVDVHDLHLFLLD